MLAIGTRMAGSPRTVSRHAWARPGAADAGAGYARALRALTPFAPALARCKRSTYARAAAPPHWAVRSAATIRTARPVRTSWGRLAGLRATAVTSWPASRAWRSNCRPTPPVAAMIVSFTVSSFFSRLIGPGQFQAHPSDEHCAGQITLLTPSVWHGPPVRPLRLHSRHRVVLAGDRKSTRLNSSHLGSSYAGFCSN